MAAEVSEPLDEELAAIAGEELAPIDEIYVMELLDVFAAQALELMAKVRRGIRDGRDLVELANLVHDALLAVELAKRAMP
jgi:hypothetical protein